MKLAVRLLLLIIGFLLLIATKILNFQTNNRNIFKNVTHAGYVNKAWFVALQNMMKNFQTTTTSALTTKTSVTKTFDNLTKNKLNNNNNFDAPVKIFTPSFDKVTPPKFQQFLPSVWIYTAHREVLP